MKGLWLNEGKFISFEELEREELSQQIFTRAQSGVFWSGMFSVFPDPDLVLQKAGNSFETFRKMMNDPHIYAEFEKRKALTTSLEFRIEIKDAQQKYHDLLDDFINSNDHELFGSMNSNENDEEDANIYDLIDVGLDAVPFGYQPVEIVWEQIGGYYLPVKMIDRPSEWFHFDQENKLRFKSKNAPWEGEPVPPKKILLFRHKPRYNNPYGVRVLSKCFWAWMFKHSTEKWKIQFLEKFAAVWAIGKLDRARENPEYENMYSALVNLINSGIGVIPNDGSVEVIDPAGKGATSKIFDENINLYNAEISKAVLTVTSLTGGESKGSYASDQVRERMVMALANSDRKIILRKTDQLFEWIFEVNGWGAAPTSDLVEPVDYMQRIALDEKLKGQGVRFSKNYFIERYNLNEDEFELNNEPSPQPPPVEFAEPDDQLSKVVKSLSSSSLQRVIEPVIKPIFKAFEESKSFEEAMEKVVEIVPGISTDDLEDLVAKLNLVSFAKGAADAQK